MPLKIKIAPLNERRMSILLYRMEDSGGPFSEKMLPIKELRRLASKIWKNECRTNRPCPKIVAGRGDPYAGRLFSFCTIEDNAKQNTIVLSRSQRKPVILIHELAHALINDYHTERFRRIYFNMLCKYNYFEIKYLKSKWLELNINASWNKLDMSKKLSRKNSKRNKITSR